MKLKLNELFMFGNADIPDCPLPRVQHLPANWEIKENQLNYRKYLRFSAGEDLCWVEFQLSPATPEGLIIRTENMTVGRVQGQLRVVAPRNKVNSSQAARRKMYCRMLVVLLRALPGAAGYGWRKLLQEWK